MLHLEQRADRILPNGWCVLPPRQSCSRGNACLTCDKFVTEATHRDELRHQLEGTVRRIDRRQQTFLGRNGTTMPGDNVWLVERQAERSALERILTVVDQATSGEAEAVRGAGSADRPQRDGDRRPRNERRRHCER